MCSAPSRRLHITDKLQVRGISSEEDLSLEFAEEQSQQSITSEHRSRQKPHILLCSPCQGRGELWLRGFEFCPLQMGCEKWVQTRLFGLWRDDGTIELLDV